MSDKTRELAGAIVKECESLDRPLNFMEVCGTHTVSLFRTGVRSLFPENLRMISGPGCPVCVTPQGYMDAACELAGDPKITVCTYGDMVRVPGANGSLAEKRAHGADVKVVYSATDALRYAVEHPETQVVFLSVGFETTTPPSAAIIKQAKAKDIRNFTVYDAHKLVIPALRALLSGDDVLIDGFLCPGHVSVIIGAQAYLPIAEEYKTPCVIAGFEGEQMLRGVLGLIEQVKNEEAKIENVYGVAVTDQGNELAWTCVNEVFEPADAEWRAIGVIPCSGLKLRPEYAEFDAIKRFGITPRQSVEPPGCRCGEVIQGMTMPTDCPLFGKGCTPSKPVGPCMVSSEGTCAAHYKYGRH